MSAGPAAATIDLTGRWIVDVTGLGSLCLDIAQSGSTLGALECAPGDPYTGTIDVDTGAFTLAQSGPCGGIAVSATAAADGATFSGLVDYGFVHCTFLGCGCVNFSDNPVSGARDACGDRFQNGASGEQCDDGNTVNGDCCSSTCQFEPFGSPCPDGDPCTVNETCGGSGACNVQIAPNGTACDDGDPCTGGDQCSGGTCAAGAPVSCVDPFKCYRARDLGNPAFASTSVGLVDEFAADGATIIKPRALCNPASVDGTVLIDPAAHLTCYKIVEPPLSAPVRIESTSSLGTVQLQIRKPKLLCERSTKTVLP